jgi:hypothetical protein
MVIVFSVELKLEYCKVIIDVWSDLTESPPAYTANL